MPVYLSQEAFNGGEITDKLSGMVHYDKYRTSLREMENFIPLPQGPAQSRPGFRYAATSALSNGTQAIVRPFIASNKQTFILEFGYQYLRFYQNQAPVMANGVPVQLITPYLDTDLTALTFAQLNDVMYIFHNSYPPMKLIWQGGTSWVLQIVAWLGGPFKDINTTTGIQITPSGTNGAITLTASTNSAAGVGAGASAILQVETVPTGFGGGTMVVLRPTMVSGGQNYNGPVTCAPASGGTGAVFTPVVKNGVITAINVTTTGLPTGYTNGDTFVFTQIMPANPCSLFSPANVGGYYMLQQNGQTTISNFSGVATGAGLQIFGEFVVNVSALSNWQGNIELQVSYDNSNWFTAAVFTTSTEQDFFENRIGVYYRLSCTQFTGGSASCTITQMLQTGIVKVSGYTSASQVTGNVITPLASTASTPFWAESALDGVNGYPSCGCFEGGRLYLAGTPSQPTTIWGSWVGDLENFAAGDTADAPVTFAIADFSNPIEWLYNHNNFICGTLGEEATLDMGVSGAISPTNPLDPKVTSTYGTQPDAAPVRIGASLLFAGFGGQSLLSMAYMFITNTYEAEDLNAAADHLFRTNSLIYVAWQEKPYKILWGLRSDGVLCGCTYDPKQKIVAWHRTVTEGLITSIACIPSSWGDTAGRTELWATVARSFPSGAITTIELLADYEGVPTQSNYTPLDCSIRQEFSHPPGQEYGTPMVVSNLSMFNGATVWAWIDGAPVGPFVVAGGQITIPVMAYVVIVGLPYTCTLYSNDLEGGAMNGISQTRTRDIMKATFRVRNTFVPGLIVGLDANNTTPLSAFVADGQQLDGAIPLYTGDVYLDDIGWPGGTERKASFYIQQTVPAPACVCLVVLPLNVGD